MSRTWRTCGATSAQQILRRYTFRSSWTRIRATSVIISAFALLCFRVKLEQARDRLKASANEYRLEFPNELGSKDFFRVTPFQEFMVSRVRPLLAILMSAVAFVLLNARNVARLLLARAAGREA